MQAVATQSHYRFDYFKTRIRSPWFLILTLVVPLVGYIAGRSYEQRITEFIIPLFPVEKDKGFAFYQDFVRLCLNEILWLSFFVLLVWWFVTAPGRLKKRQFEITLTNAQLLISVAIFFSLTLAISWFVLEAFPNSSDEYSYLMQAEMLSRGQFSDTAPAYADAFYHNHIAVKDDIRVGRFPPGWPLLLSTAYVLGIPAWWINPIVGSLSLLLLFAYSNRYHGRQVALWTVAITGVSSYFLFNAASYFSHVSCFMAVLGFVWLFRLYEDKGQRHYLLLAGICIGIVGLIRYYTAVLVFAPFATYWLYHRKFKAIAPLFWIGAGALPCAAFLFFYNYSLTGSPLTPVTTWAYEDETLGFVKGHTVLKGGEHIVRWLFMFMYWCSPGVLILYFVFIIKKMRAAASAWTHPEDYFFVILLAGYFFYYQIGGNQYGPRFLLEAFPFLSLFVVRSVMQSRFSATYSAVLVAGLIFSIAKFPSIVSREKRIINERQDLYDQVVQHRIHDAVVVVTTATSPVRPMPIGDLTRNENDFDGDVLYIQDAPGMTEAVMAQYVKSKAYRYSRELDNPQGKLVRIR